MGAIYLYIYFGSNGNCVFLDDSIVFLRGVACSADRNDCNLLYEVSVDFWTVVSSGYL